MTSRIVHVVSTPSFMDFVSDVFEEVAPGQNTFVGVGLSSESLRLASGARFEKVERDEPGQRRVAELIAGCTITVFHNLQETFTARALASAPDSVLRVWSGWGGDYYGGSIDPLSGLVGPRTRWHVERGRSRSYWVDRVLAARKLAPELRRAAFAADVFSAPIVEDLAVYRRRFPTFRGAYQQLNYGSVEDMFSIGPDEVTGRDILLGNSATPENNHLDVLPRLGVQNLGDSRVFAPLSYGYPEYAEVVTEHGRRILGDRFVPITERMSLVDYHEMLAGCSVIVMGHRRQQGVGNLFRAMWQGAHVVLDKRSPMVDHLRRRGAVVEVLGEVDIGRLVSTPQAPEVIAANRDVLMTSWSRPVVLSNVRALLARAESH